VKRARGYLRLNLTMYSNMKAVARSVSNVGTKSHDKDADDRDSGRPAEPTAPQKRHKAEIRSSNLGEVRRWHGQYGGKRQP